LNGENDDAQSLKTLLKMKRQVKIQPSSSLGFPTQTLASNKLASEKTVTTIASLRATGMNLVVDLAG
jgi:hypothetical protein